MSEQSPTVEKKKLPPLKKRMAAAVLGKAKGHNGGGRKVNEDGYTAQQERFCELFASDKEFFGNGVQSYIEAYEVTVGKGKGMTSYETCKFRAHKLLSDPRILKRINEVMESGFLNDVFVDKQLEFLIRQNSEYHPKLGAIKEYNALKKRITQLHEHRFDDLSKMTDKELAAEEERLMKVLKKK